MNDNSLPITDQAMQMLTKSKLLAKMQGAAPRGVHFLMSVPKKPLTMSKHILDELGIEIDQLHRVIEAIYQQNHSFTSVAMPLRFFR